MKISKFLTKYKGLKKALFIIAVIFLALSASCTGNTGRGNETTAPVDGDRTDGLTGRNDSETEKKSDTPDGTGALTGNNDSNAVTESGKDTVTGNEETVTEPETEAADDDDGFLTIAGNGVSSYRIIVERNMGSEQLSGMRTFIKAVQAVTGAGIEVVYSGSAGDVPREKEILIGDTGRAESRKASAGLGEFDYVIKTSGKKLIITGGSKTAIRCALEDFSEIYLSGGGRALRIPHGLNLKYLSGKSGEKKETEGGLPRVYLNMPYKKTVNGEAKVTVRYRDGAQSFDCYGTIKIQGSSSRRYVKKNYNLKLYKDAELTDRKKVSFGDWGKASKYCLKANYTDCTHARNIVSARLWGEVCSSRPTLNERQKNLTNAGAVDGFPVYLYLNGEFIGLYTLNIPKDEWSFGMDDREYEAALFSANWNDPCVMRALTDGVSDWEVIYSYNDKTDWAVESFNNLISFIIENDGKDFIEGIDRYLDVDAAIDYMLTMYYICARDNMGKNMIMATYDGVKWIPSMYDLDTTFGIFFDGTGFYPADDTILTVNANGTIKTNAGSLLWQRLLDNYGQRVKERYFGLRKSVFTVEHIMGLFYEFTDGIPELLYLEDRALYPGIPSVSQNTLKQIEDFLTAREVLLDRQISKLG